LPLNDTLFLVFFGTSSSAFNVAVDEYLTSCNDTHGSHGTLADRRHLVGEDGTDDHDALCRASNDITDGRT